MKAQATLGVVDAPPALENDRGFTVGIYTALALVMGAVAITGWQSVSWLKTGFWPTLRVADVLGKPALQTGWKGANQLLAMPFKAPLSMTMILAASAIVWWLTRSNEHA